MYAREFNVHCTRPIFLLLFLFFDSEVETKIQMNVVDYLCRSLWWIVDSSQFCIVLFIVRLQLRLNSVYVDLDKKKKKNINRSGTHVSNAIIQFWLSFDNFIVPIVVYHKRTVLKKITFNFPKDLCVFAIFQLRLYRWISIRINNYDLCIQFTFHENNEMVMQYMTSSDIINLVEVKFSLF